MSESGLSGLDRDRFRGALLGLAVGDALGTTVEFKAPGSFEPVVDIVGGGHFSLPAGAWTDDTSMALCLAESLIECRGFDPVDQLQRYVRWWRDGHLSSTGRCFDIGPGTSASLARFERTGEPYPGDAFPKGGGNGALMRLAPIPMAFALRPQEVGARAAESARTTHGAPEAADAARYFAELTLGALRGVGKEELIGGAAYSLPGSNRSGALHSKVAKVAAGSFRERQPPDITGKGYVIPALESALWALFTTENFVDGVRAAANLGNDADTTAAIFGQLAGALYGLDAIPERWRGQVVMADEIVAFADGLFELASELEKTDV